MEKETLYDLAIAMMESTNPYDRKVEDFHYLLKRDAEEECDLCKLVKKQIGRKSRSTKRDGAQQKDYEN